MAFGDERQAVRACAEVVSQGSDDIAVVAESRTVDLTDGADIRRLLVPHVHRTQVTLKAACEGAVSSARLDSP